MDSMPAQAKKPRCFSQEKLIFKRHKQRQRWNGLSRSKQQQVRDYAKASLAAKQLAVAAKQQQLVAKEQKLSQDEQQLQATARQKFREADAAKRHAHRTTAWASNLVRSELGGNKLSRAISLEARLVDTGYVNLPAARRAAAVKDAQDEITDKSRLSVLQRGLSVWHFDREGRPRAATIGHVHDDDYPPYYTITFDDTTGEAPRDTVRERLVPM